MKGDFRICPRTHDWCNRAECKHGVHFTPEGWAWLKLEGGEKVPEPPAYFRAKVDALVRASLKTRMPSSKAKAASPPRKMAWKTEEVQTTMPEDNLPASGLDPGKPEEFPALAPAKKSSPQRQKTSAQPPKATGVTKEKGQTSSTFEASSGFRNVSPDACVSGESVRTLEEEAFREEKSKWGAFCRARGSTGTWKLKAHPNALAKPQNVPFRAEPFLPGSATLNRSRQA